MIPILFWGASFLVVYPYAIYPLLLRLMIRHGREEPPSDEAPADPSITLIISAYNEQSVIREKLRNSLLLDYPLDKLDIMVVSDASSDGTDDIVREEQLVDGRIRLLRLPKRSGKSTGLNTAVEMARGEIVVFSDANAIYERSALRELVRPFSDHRVGYVVGAALYHGSDGNTAAESEGLYWRLELWLKQLESEFGSVVGGDGAIYAIRRSLFRPLLEDDISDFVNPLQIVAAGYRGCFNGRARSYERAGDSFAKEFRRRRRIVNRSWRAVRRYRHLLGLRRHGRFIFMLMSHKILRWLALPLIAIAWTANCLLWGTSALYAATGSAITASLLLGAVGAVLESLGRRAPRVVATLCYFYTINLAGLLGIWDEYRGIRHVTWDHIRKAAP